MIDYTTFAGLERLDPGDPLDAAFLRGNITIIDRLLRVGATTHRHDGHAAITAPVAAPTAVTAAVGGTIPADTSLSIVYTYIDGDGGETIASPDVTITTETGLVAPTDAPGATVDNAAGTLDAHTYYYAVTISDGLGGETELSPFATAVVDPGFPNAEVTLDGLAALITEAGGTDWKMWRAVDGGTWYYLGSGTTDTFLDDGSHAADCSIQPPSVGTTQGANTITVNCPGPAPAGAVSYNIYGSTDGSFSGACLLGNYPVAELAADKLFTSITLLDGSPPITSLALPGADKIDPDTEILGVFKRPVANAAALPGAGNDDGDIRETLNDHTLHVWTGAAWAALGGGGGGGGASLINPMDTHIEWQDATGTTRARVYGTLATQENLAPATDYYQISGHADEDPANGNAGYQTLTNEVKPSTTTDRSTLDTDGAWSTASLVWGKANRDCHILSVADFIRLGIGFGDVTTHVGIFAWILKGATWKLQIVARTDGSGYGGTSEAGFTVIAEDDLPTPVDGDFMWLTFEQKPNNMVSATVGMGKATVGDIPDTALPAGAITDAFGDAGTVTKTLMTADRWAATDAWETGNIEMYNVTVVPQIWAEALPYGSTSWVQHLISDSSPTRVSMDASSLYLASTVWAPDTTVAEPLFYYDDPDQGHVRLSGRMVRTGGTAFANGETLGQIKPWPLAPARPFQTITQTIVVGDNNGQGIGILTIQTDGTMSFTTDYAIDISASPWVSFDGVSYS